MITTSEMVKIVAGLEGGSMGKDGRFLSGICLLFLGSSQQANLLLVTPLTFYFG